MPTKPLMDSPSEVCGGFCGGCGDGGSTSLLLNPESANQALLACTTVELLSSSPQITSRPPGSLRMWWGYW
jgi:hypothetical protein